MWTRNSLLIVLLYTGLCVLVAVVSYGVFVAYRSGGAGQRITSNQFATSPDRERRPPAPTSSRKRVHSAVLLDRAEERVRQLERALEDAEAKLARQREEIRRRTAECEKLQRQLDDTLSFIIDLSIQNELLPAQLVGDVGNGLSDALRQQLESELERLRSELRKASFVEAEQAAAMDDLRRELVEAESELATTQVEAAVELGALQEEKELIQQAAAEAIAGTGEAAVVPLMSLLSHPSPAVRAWAAGTLGELGRSAQPAVPLLRDLLTDGDENTRLAAQRALERIGS